MNISEFNFKSQICTSRVQSERLLSLGLNKETADMFWWDNGCGFCAVISRPAEKEDGEYGKVIPAWSLHRLLSLIEYDDGFIDVSLRGARYGIHYGYDDGWYDNLYGAVISCIEALIEEKDFNKEYLEE